MPRIKEYTNQQNFSGDPIAGAARVQEVAGYQSGQAIKQGFNELAGGVKEVEQHVAQNETTKLAADLATAHAELAEEWRQTAAKADPNDHEAASRFMEQRVKPRLDKLGEGLLTEQAQQAFTRSSAGLQAELFTKTAADQASLAGEAAIANIDTMKNQYSNVLRADPSSLENVQALTRSSIEGMVQSFGLPREAALKLNNQLLAENAKAAAYGAADLNPTEARKSLDRGDYNKYLDGTEVKSLMDYAERQEKAADTAARAADAQKREQEKEDFRQVGAKLSGQLIGNAPTPQFFKDLEKASLMPGANEGAINALRSAGQTALDNPHIISDSATRTDLMSGIWRQDDDPSKTSLQDIDQAYGDKLLSKADYTAIRQSLLDSGKDPKKTENMRQLSQKITSYKAFISRSGIQGVDADGDKRYGDMMQDKTVQFQDGLKNGLTAREMLDETNKNFLFKDVARYKPPADTERFAKSMNGGLGTPIGPAPTIPWSAAPNFRRNTQTPAGAQAPAAPNIVPSTLSTRIPGESAADFLKRNR